MTKFYVINRRKKIIQEGSCKIKHVFDKKQIMKLSISFDMSTEIPCLRCGTKQNLAQMIAYVAEKENINLGDKASLFKKFIKISDEDKKNEST